MKDNEIISQAVAEALKALSSEVHYLANMMFMFFLAFILVSFYAIYQHRKWEKKNAQEGYFEVEVAQELYEQASYGELIKYCEKTLKKYKNNIHAVWYLALANYQSKDYLKASELFHKVLQLNPSWKEDVNTYLSEIQNKSECSKESNH